MNFKELKDEYSFIDAKWNHVHAEKTDPKADSEYWHTPVTCHGVPFANCIREYVYGDGTTKLFINYTSWTREKYNVEKDSQEYMGVLARKLPESYPDLNYILDTGWVELKPDTYEMEKFAEIYESISTNVKLMSSTSKPLIKEVPEGSSEDDDG